MERATRFRVARALVRVATPSSLRFTSRPAAGSVVGGSSLSRLDRSRFPAAALAVLFVIAGLLLFGGALGAQDPSDKPVVTIVAGPTPVTEGMTAQFVVSRTGLTKGALTVSVDVAETGSMISGTAPTSIVLESGEGSKKLLVPTDQDDRNEPDSAITATLVGDRGAAYEVGTEGSATVVVEDDDQESVPSVPVVSFTAWPNRILEGGDALYAFSRTGPTTETLTVAVEVTETGSTIDGSIPTSVVFAAGADQTSLILQTVDDLVREPDSVITVTLVAGSDAPYALTSVASVETTVTDDDGQAQEVVPVITVEPKEMTVTEGEDVSFKIHREGQEEESLDVVVEVSTTGSSGMPGTNTLTLLEGITEFTYGFSTTDDDRHEGNRTVTLTVKEPTGTSYQVGSPSSATVTVEDNDDFAVEVTTAVVDANGTAVSEVDEDVETATVRLTATTNGSVAPTARFLVSIGSRADSAESPDDFGALSAVVSFAVAAFALDEGDNVYKATRDIPLRIVDDSDEENRERLELVTEMLPGHPGWLSFSNPRIELTIVDNDSAPIEPTAGPPEPELPEVTIAAETTSVTEGEAVTFTLSRSGDTLSSVTVSVDLSETGSMIRGAAPTSAVFDVGEVGTTLTVRTIDDSVDEPDSVITAILTAEPNAGYVIGASDSATVTVSDDDDPAPVVTVTVPGPPTDLVVAADGQTAIDLSWTAPTDTGGGAITAYRIEWSVFGDGNWAVLVEDTGSTATSYSDRGLPAGTLRHYRVSALNSAGIGPPSSVSGAETSLPPAEVTIRSANGPVVEGEEAVFVLRRSAVTTDLLTVSLQVTGEGSIVGGEAPASAIFAAGEQAATLVIPTTDDTVDGPDRKIAVTLLEGEDYILGAVVSATVRVTDNDAAPVLSIAGASAPESGGDLRFQINLEGKTSMPVTVEWNTSPGTATADRDYAAESGVLTLDPGSAGGAIVIFLHDDSLFEENETFTVSLSRPKHAELGVGTSSATGVIENDDAAPVVRIADASAAESAGEMVFAVTLSGETALPVRVDWASARGTAQPDQDYVDARGALDLRPGETGAMVRVTLLEDLLLEDPETFLVELGAARNATFGEGARAVATGTIEDDDDAAPAEAWLARFGRAAASNAVGAVEDRLTGRLGSGGQVVVAGHRVDVAGGGQGNGAAGAAAAPVAGLGGIRQAAGGAAALAGFGGGLLDTQPGRYGSGRNNVGDVLARSSFHFSSDSHASGYSNRGTAAGAAHGGDGGNRWSVWGSGAATRFDGGEDTLSLDGEVTTGTVGADIERGRVLFGVAVSHSRGDGDYRRDAVGGLRDREGDLSSDLTTGLPYLRVAVSDRLSVWGALGHGSGSMALSEGDLGSVDADIAMSLGAFGARQELRSSAKADGFSLALRTDLLLVHTTSDETEALPALEADMNRLRLMIEGARRWQFDSGVVLTPKVELGLRYDDGDAETGGGVEVGAGLRLEDAAQGLSVELTGRSLLAHEASEISEWGVGGSLRFEPGGGDRGLSIGLRSTLGAASSGIARLWEQQNAAPAAHRAVAPGSVMEAEIGYGLAVPGSRSRLTPYLGAGLSERSGAAYRIGARLRVGEFFALDAEAARVERNDATPSLYRAALLASLRW